MQQPHLTVAILTYRRPEQLSVNLDSVVEGVREAADLADVRILVVDNDPEGSAREAATRPRGASIEYACEPMPGIPAARNRALDESAESRLLAFIDDDEIPRPGWLVELIRAWRRYEADAVMGRVISDMPDGADRRIIAGGFFVRPSRPTGTVLPSAATGNLLLDLDTVRRTGVRFDESLGLGGGEDTVFTTQLVRAGARIVWCEESVTVDPVVPERATWEWMRRRAFAHGNVLQRTRQKLARGRVQRARTRLSGLVGGPARIVVGAVQAGWGVISRNLRHEARGIRGVLRGAGVFMAAAGHQHLEYGRPKGSART